jgi:hypothetical protein
MDSFIKSHGIVKDEMIKKLDSTMIETRLHVFDEIDRLVVINWKDDKTIAFICTSDHQYLQFWQSGKKIKQFEYNETLETKLLTVCLEYYAHLERCGKWGRFLM